MDGTAEERREHATPVDSQEDLFEGIVRAVEEHLGQGAVAIGFGVPSQVDHERGTVGGSVNFSLLQIVSPGDEFAITVHATARPQASP